VPRPRGRQALAARHPSATNGSRGNSMTVSGRAAGSGISCARVSAVDAGRWAWPLPRYPVARGEWPGGSRDPRSAAGRSATPPRVPRAQPDDDQVVAFELVLAPPWCHEQPVGIEPDGQVASPAEIRPRARAGDPPRAAHRRRSPGPASPSRQSYVRALPPGVTCERLAASLRRRDRSGRGPGQARSRRRSRRSRRRAVERRRLEADRFGAPWTIEGDHLTCSQAAGGGFVAAEPRACL
jgi:hypothetical protein